MRVATQCIKVLLALSMLHGASLASDPVSHRPLKVFVGVLTAPENAWRRDIGIYV